MPIIMHPSYDLGHESVCDWLHTSDVHFIFRPDIVATIVDDGYDHEKDNFVQKSEDEVVLAKYIETEWRAVYRDSGRPYRNFKSFKIYRVLCKVRPVTQIFLLNTLDGEKKRKAISLFDSFDVIRLEREGAAYIGELERAAHNDGIEADDYYVIVTFYLYRESDQFVSDTFPSLERALDPDLENRQFSLAHLSDINKCGVPDFGFEDTEIVVPDVDDESAIEPILERELRDVSTGYDCTNIEFSHHRIGNILDVPEFKIEWKKKVLKIGRCTFLTLIYPQFWIRTRKNILYVSVAIADSVFDAMKKGVEECVVYSAAATTLLAIITSGTSLSMAYQIFYGVFQKCIEVKFGTTVRCIIPRLQILVEREEWRKL